MSTTGTLENEQREVKTPERWMVDGFRRGSWLPEIGALFLKCPFFRGKRTRSELFGNGYEVTTPGGERKQTTKNRTRKIQKMLRLGFIIGTW